MIESKIQAEPPRGGIEDAHALGNGFLADAVAWDDGDSMSGHHGLLMVGACGGQAARRSTAERSDGGSGTGRRLARST